MMKVIWLALMENNLIAIFSLSDQFLSVYNICWNFILTLDAHFHIVIAKQRYYLSLKPIKLPSSSNI
jgi:hypothetical protein